MYKVGDRVVCYGQAVGTVTSIGDMYRYFVLQMDDGSIRYALWYHLDMLA